MTTVLKLKNASFPATNPKLKTDPVEYDGLKALIDFNRSNTYPSGAATVGNGTQFGTLETLGAVIELEGGTATYDSSDKSLSIPSGVSLVAARNGTDDYGDLGLPYGTTGELVACLWFKPDPSVVPFNSYLSIISVEGEGDSTVKSQPLRIGTRIQADSQFSFSTGSGDAYSDIQWDLGTDEASIWYHMAIHCIAGSGADVHAWVNGVKQSRGNGQSTFAPKLAADCPFGINRGTGFAAKYRRAWLGVDPVSHGTTADALVAADYALFQAADLNA